MDDLRTPASTWRQGFFVARRGLLGVTVAFAILAGACTAAGGTATAVPTAVPTESLVVDPTPDPSANVAPTAAAYPLTLIDDEGTTIVLPAQPRTIVSLTPATTELLFALGAGGRLVAGTDFDDYPPEAAALPDVATFTSVDVEQIATLGADLVLAGGNSFNPPAAIEQLRRLGIPVLVLYAPDVEGVLADIELVGRAIGNEADARAMTEAMRAAFAGVGRAVEGRPRPRVFYELDATQEIFGPADGSFVAEMIVLAGGEPITTGSPTSFSIALERLVEADPEVIVLGDAAYGVTAEQVAARAGWGTMTAVADCAIRPVDDLLVTRPGPRLAEGLRLLALAIHPDADLPGPVASPAPASPSPAPAC